jgi:YVTN family beta-propeller protein
MKRSKTFLLVICSLFLTVSFVWADWVTATINAGAGPRAIAVNPFTNKIYCANNGSANVTVIDGATNSTTTVNVVSGPAAIAINPVTNKIYVNNYTSDSVTVIDGTDNSKINIYVGTGPGTLALNPVTNRIYVVHTNRNVVTVINGENDNVVSTVSVGTGPFAIAVNTVTNKIYVANVSTNNVTVIDGLDNSTSTITVGTGPRDVAVNPVTNKIYVANLGSNNVTVINGSDNSKTTVSAGSSPYALVVNPVTNKIYVLNGGSNTVTVINGSNNSTSTIPIGLNLQSIVVNSISNKIYISNYGNDLVTIIDGNDNSKTTVSAGDGPYPLTVNPVTNKVYVGNWFSNNVTIIDGANNTTATVTAGTGPRAVAVNPVTNKIYVANYNSANVTVINGADNTTATVAAGTVPCAVAVNPVTNKIYVVNQYSANVTVIDGTDNSTTTVTVGMFPSAVAVNLATNKIYIANANSDNVTVINGTDNSTATVTAGIYPSAVAVNAVTNKVYVANRGGTVTVIDGADNSTTNVTAGNQPYAVAVNPVTNKIYVANNSSNNVTVIDGADNSTTNLAVGFNPLAIAVNPLTNKIYVVNNSSNNVTVIDGADNSTTTVTVGTTPVAVVVNPVTNKIYITNINSDNVTVINGVDNTKTTVTAGYRPWGISVNQVTNKIYVGNNGTANVTVITDIVQNDTKVTAEMNRLSGDTTLVARPAITGKAVNRSLPYRTDLIGVGNQLNTAQQTWNWATTSKSDSINWTYNWGTDSLILGENFICVQPFETDAASTNNNNYGIGAVFTGNIAVYPIYRMNTIHDVSITEIIQPIGDVDSTGKIAPKVKVKNNGNLIESFFDIYFETSGGYSNSKSVSALDIDEERIIEFDSMVVGPRGTYTTRCSTYIADDVNPSDNVKRDSFRIGVHDVGVGEIMHPVANIDSTRKTPVKATVVNNGTFIESFFDVFVEIPESTKSYASVRAVTNLAVGETREIEFDSLTIGPRGMYQVKCSTALNTDMVSDNNVKHDSFTIIVSDAGVSAIDTPLTNHDKRILFTPTATVFNNSSQAEDVPVIMEIWKDAVGINESFENTTFPPSGWAVYENDGGTHTWYRNQSIPHTGIAHAICLWESPTRQNDDWLVTKQHLVRPGDSLKFWYLASDINYYELLTVRISTASNAISDFTTRLDSFHFNNLSYLEKKISLDAYVGQNVYLAIINRGLNRYYLRVDDVSVGYHPQSLVYRDSVMAMGLGGSDALAQVMFKPCTLNIDGGYQALCYTKLAGDMNTANDQMSKMFTIDNIPLVLNSPNNGITTNDNTPWFDWNDVARVAKYRIQIDDNSSYTSPVINELVSISEYQVVTDAACSDGLYYWHVRSESTGTADPYSETRELTIDTQGPVAPVLVAPTNNLITNDQTPMFDWNSVGDAVLYNLLVETGETIVTNETLAGTDYTPVSNLGEGGYIWKVKARDAYENWGDYSGAWTFTIDTTGPAAPTLICPTDNFITNDTLPVFFWHDNIDADSFNLVISTAKTEEVNIVLTDTFYISSSGLSQGIYTWQVRGIDAVGNWGGFSSTWTLTIDITPPNIPALITPDDSLLTNNTLPEFSWSAVIGANNYNLVVDNGTKTDVINIETSALSYTPASPLLEGIYAWSVKAQDSAGNWSDFAPVNVFTIDTTPSIPPVLQTPVNNAIINLVQPEFTWDSVPDAKFYNVIIETGKWIVYDETASATRFIPWPLLEGVYSWKVKSRDWAGNWGEFSNAWNFTIDTTRPEMPVIINPIAGETLRTETQVISWNQIGDAVEYELSVEESKTTYLTDQTSYTLSLGSGNWTCQVRARDLAENWSDYSPAVYFTLELPAWVKLADEVPQATDVKPGKRVKDGGSMIALGSDFYLFPGNKSRWFMTYTPGLDSPFVLLETIPDTYKYKYGVGPDPEKIAKNKKIKKGAALCYDGEATIYATKGGGLYEFWAYDMTTETIPHPNPESVQYILPHWEAKAYVPTVKGLKGGTSMAWLNGKLYLLAGSQKSGNPFFFSYDPAGDTALGTPWTTLTPPGYGMFSKLWKDGSAITTMNGLIYALKGKDKYNPLWVYDPSQDTLLGTPWLELESIPLGYPTSMIEKPKKVKVGDGGALTTDGSVLYAIKGGGKQDFWMYTPAYDTLPGTWTPLCTIPKGLGGKKMVPKTGAALAYANNYVWLMKGNNNAELWRYNVFAKDFAMTRGPRTIASSMVEHTNATSLLSLSVTPNPFTNLAVVRYTVPVTGKVSIKLYNSAGRLSETLLNENLNAGTYTMNLNANSLAKGVYFLKYRVNNNKSELKLIVQ